ncbi:nucleoside kinase [Anaeromicropila herbilytica]|nr:nucleoside kinase [Anaeromicropila herbilytica]
MLNITVNGVVKQYPKGTMLSEISKEHEKEFEDDIILAYRDGRLRELFKTVQKDSIVQFVTTKDDTGHKTYQRGMILVMLKAIYGELGREQIKKVMVEYSISSGYFCRIEGVGEITDEMIAKIKRKMTQIIQDDIPFEKKVLGTNEAKELFHYYKMYDKEKLFKYRRVSTANIYSLAGFEDYFYGYMPASTGILKYFDIFKYDDGLILMIPDKSNTREIIPFKPLPKLYATLKQSNDWGKAMEIETVGDLNEHISKGEFSDLLLVQEALQEKKIAQIAELIKEAGNRKFVMIAGPSSSGKTTFSHRLSIQLRTYGLKPHPIAVDDYFVNRDLTPLDKDGKPNFESILAVDVEQFNKDMTDLLNGKTVELPTYNFKSGIREYKGNYKTLGKDDILVIEGIHGLNDKLSYSLPRESKFKIYISALTQLNIDEHNRIPTTDGRLIRRMVRDARTRGTSAKETIAMWASVRRGEEENIFPFQEEADVMFNSALIYELSILKQYAEPILFGIDSDCEEYQEAKRLLKFLDYFLGVSSEDIPKNSILREFIGGSCFKV